MFFPFLLLNYSTILFFCQANLHLFKRPLFPRNRPGLSRKPSVIPGDVSPLILRVAVSSLAEILIDILLPPELYARSGEALLVPGSVGDNAAVFLLSHGTLHLPHLLGSFVGCVSPPLIGKRRLVYILEFLLGVNRLGHAEDYREYIMAAVRLAYERLDYPLILLLRVLPPLIHRMGRSRTRVRRHLPAVRA